MAKLLSEIGDHELLLELRNHDMSEHAFLADREQHRAMLALLHTTSQRTYAVDVA
jgi:hypothetical protein